MEPDTVAAIIETARRSWNIRNSVEISLEANPSSVDSGRFRDFAQAGVSRVSIGVQSLVDDDLRRLGRLHTAKDALRAWEIASSVFDRVSMDLIYARQYQTASRWEKELRLALSLSPAHLSLYQLTIEPNTVFGDRYALNKLTGLPSDDSCADMYELTKSLCADAGLNAYEVSNYAQPRQECLHNLIYWRYGDYAGIGPGAHGRLALGGIRYAQESVRNPSTWLEASENGRRASWTLNPLSRTDQATEFLLMGLRLDEGVSLRRWASIRGSNVAMDRVDQLVADGLLWICGDAMGTTERGRMVLDRILQEMI